MKNQLVRLAEKVLGHMSHYSEGHHKGGVLLTGDPGVGKTTFVETLASLLGIHAVVVEVPHITEEHLINIPFIVFNPQSNSTQTGVQQITSEYKLVLAQSNLYNQLAHARPMEDHAYIEHIKHSPNYIQQLYKAFGGTETKIPDAFKQARQTYGVILFLDEYYRQTSMRIRNILRGILNNKIGMHTIPDNVYIMYASNMRDQGLESIPPNNQFTAIDYKTPRKEDWFDWLVAKYQNDTHVRLNENIIKHFKKLLKDEHMSYVDVAKEVRTSPRRWEQLLLYINSGIPVRDEQDARALITNVRNNFINYQTGQHSDLADKIVDATAKLIKETSNVDVSSSNLLEPHEWREALNHQVEQAMKLGERRKYIPVVSGPPGIGKTAQAAAVADKHNLRLIEIEVSQLNPDDVVGLPLPGDRKDEEIAVKFSVPKLYREIMDKIKHADEAYIADLKKKYGTDANKHISAYMDQRWKYLIFFDEINTVDEKTFNALRRVILEKNFGPSGDESGKLIELPKSAIVVAAMNPQGSHTTEMTQHFKDVVDIIPASASWKQTKQWLGAKKFKGIPEEVSTVAMNVMQAFVDKFKEKGSEHSADQRPFHLDVGSPLYISPREYTDIYATLVRELNSGISKVLNDDSIKADQIRSEIDDVIGEALEDSLNFIFDKHGVDKEEFMHQLKAWVSALDASILGGVLSKKAKTTPMGQTLSSYMDGKNITNMSDDIDIINANNSVNNAQFIEDVRDMIVSKLKDDASIQQYILKEDQPKVTLKGDTITTDPSTKVSSFENFILALLYTLHIHKYQNDRVASVGRALSSSLSETISKLFKANKITDDVKDEVATSTVQLRSDIHDLLSKLK
jgi:MoxR-like ATPase